MTELAIRGGLCLLPGRGLTRVDIHLCGTTIAAIAEPSPRRTFDFDADGCLVLPGIVDIHGDAFERQIMPRPGTAFPLDMAMIDTDRQLVANGITTAFHGITVSWEPGLRSLEEALRIIACLDRLDAHLHADHRIHIRWETFALDAVSEVHGLLRREKPLLLAFNDHTTPSIRQTGNMTKLLRWADRAGITPQGYRSRLHHAAERADEVPSAVRKIADACRSAGVAMLSHDDDDAATRQAYRSMGVAIAEFPLNRDSLACAADGGDEIVLGAPNVVRGGSHNGAIGAEAAIRDGMCTILASDYYYPAPLAAAVCLAERQVLSFEKAWDLISANPARAAKLADRGRIAEGLRADLVVLPVGVPRTVATFAAGRLVYACR